MRKTARPVVWEDGTGDPVGALKNRVYRIRNLFAKTGVPGTRGRSPRGVGSSSRVIELAIVRSPVFPFLHH